MVNRLSLFLVLAGAALSGMAAATPQHPKMPAGMTHEERLASMRREAELKNRGAVAMGFDQTKVTHHFRLTDSGGAIDVAANASGDLESRDRIRAHLSTIAREFANGVFTSPAATHAEVPPGVPVMRDLRRLIRYVFEETPNGGRVRIDTTSLKARTAVHEFLRYQIREHATGDPVTVQ